MEGEFFFQKIAQSGKGLCCENIGEVGDWSFRYTFCDRPQIDINHPSRWWWWWWWWWWCCCSCCCGCVCIPFQSLDWRRGLQGGTQQQINIIYIYTHMCIYIYYDIPLVPDCKLQPLHNDCKDHLIPVKGHEITELHRSRMITSQTFPCTLFPRKDFLGLSWKNISTKIRWFKHPSLWLKWYFLGIPCRLFSKYIASAKFETPQTLLDLYKTVQCIEEVWMNGNINQQKTWQKNSHTVERRTQGFLNPKAPRGFTTSSFLSVVVAWVVRRGPIRSVFFLGNGKLLGPRCGFGIFRFWQLESICWDDVIPTLKVKASPFVSSP